MSFSSFLQLYCNAFALSIGICIVSCAIRLLSHVRTCQSFLFCFVFSCCFLCHIMLRRATFCCLASSHTIPSRVVSCHTASCYIVSCHTILCYKRQSYTLL